MKGQTCQPVYPTMSPAAPPWVCWAQDLPPSLSDAPPPSNPRTSGRGARPPRAHRRQPLHPPAHHRVHLLCPATRKNTGDVKLEKYDTSAGEHQPATRTEKPKNVPKPLLSDKAKEKTIDGLYEKHRLYRGLYAVPLPDRRYGALREMRSGVIRKSRVCPVTLMLQRCSK